MLEAKMGKKLGDSDDPMLVSVRSGAPFSMPGMMDTILNLGLNDVSVQGLIAPDRQRPVRLDSYRRFVQMFSRSCSKSRAICSRTPSPRWKQARGVRQDTPTYRRGPREADPRQFKDIVAQHVSPAEFPELVSNGRCRVPAGRRPSSCGCPSRPCSSLG